ncbi:MAG TPA: PKD domain-containing protein [Solirubrobacterales bacterium]|nr:PKD domain-containing protein [Solirubrobacterales bacterium]
MRRGTWAALVAAATTTALVAATSLGASTALARVAYVSAENLNSVSAIDLAAGKEVGSRITVGTEPYGVAISPDGSRAYVANRGSSTVSVIDTATDAVVGKAIPIGINAKPVTVVVSPDGRHVYVRCMNVAKTFVIDTATGVVVQEIPVEARGIALSPDGKSLYIAELPDRVGVYDAATGKPTGQVLEAETDPSELEVSPDGATLYALHFGGVGKVTKIDLASAAHTPITVGESPVSMALTPNGRRLFVGRETPVHGHLTVVETATDSTVGGPIEIGGGPAAMAVAPAGDFAYTGIGSAADGAIQSIDTNTLAIGTAGSTYGTHLGLAIVPDQGPVARLAATLSGVTATLNAAASSDPDGKVASYGWDFGDGTTASGPAAEVSHTYAPGGTYTARVTPVDDEGCAATRVWTGVAALCNPSAAPSATVTIAVPVAPPPTAGDVAAPGPLAPGRGSTPAPGGVATLRLGRLRLNPANGTARLVAIVSGQGKLTVGGQAAHRSVRVKKAGKVTLAIAPGAGVKRVLERKGHAGAKVTVRFDAPGLPAVRTKRTIGFIERLRGHGRR